MTTATLSAAFTPLDDGALLIHLLILDTTQQTVLWETKVTDTPAQDEVLPNRRVRGLLMTPESNPTPFTGIEFFATVGICDLNTTIAPAGPVQDNLDNVQVLEYPTPAAEIERSVCVSWPEGTLEEQIIVGSSSLGTNAVWTPVAEPIFKRNGQLCVDVPLTSTEQYLQSVPWPPR